jgi:carboxymethylenebutenolidase
MGQTTRIESPDGGTDAYLAPAASAPGPPVVALHAWWGLNPTFRDFVDRLAGDGFTVLGPDLFDGKVLGTIQEAEAFSQELDEEANAERLLGRAAACLDHVLTLPETRGQRAGVLGFSFGAVYARWLAKTRREIAAVVTYYGGSWDPPVDAQVPPAPWLGHWAADDPYEDSAEAAKLQERQAQAGTVSVAHLYDGTRHWFAEPDRPEHDEAASELAYQRTLEFLRAQLG